MDKLNAGEESARPNAENLKKARYSLFKKLTGRRGVSLGEFHLQAAADVWDYEFQVFRQAKETAAGLDFDGTTPICLELVCYPIAAVDARRKPQKIVCLLRTSSGHTDLLIPKEWVNLTALSNDWRFGMGKAERYYDGFELRGADQSTINLSNLSLIPANESV